MTYKNNSIKQINKINNSMQKNTNTKQLNH